MHSRRHFAGALRFCSGNLWEGPPLVWRVRYLTALSFLAFTSPGLARLNERGDFLLLVHSKGQAMGRGFGVEAVYLAADGCLQRSLEDLGDADTVQKAELAMIDPASALRIIAYAEGLLRQENSAPRSAAENNQTTLPPIPDIFPATDSVEVWTHANQKTSLQEFPGSQMHKARIEPIIEMIEKQSLGAQWRTISGTRFIRSQRISDPRTLESWHKAGLVNLIGESELRRAKSAAEAVTHPGRLVPVDGRQPFAVLSGFRWPFDRPYTVVLQIGKDVFLIRAKTTQGNEYAK